MPRTGALGAEGEATLKGNHFIRCYERPTLLYRIHTTQNKVFTGFTLVSDLFFKRGRVLEVRGEDCKGEKLKIEYVQV